MAQSGSRVTVAGHLRAMGRAARWMRARGGRGGEKEGGGDLARESGDVVERKGSALGVEDDTAEGRALDKVHDDEGEAALAAERVEADDIGVRESGEGLGFAAEAVDELDIFGEVFAHDLDGDGVLAAGVVGFVDLRHTATADELLDAVASLKDLSNQVRHRTLRRKMVSCIRLGTHAAGNAWCSCLALPVGSLLSYQDGASSRPGAVVRRVWLLPSEFITKMSFLPCLSDTKAILFPSGDQTGL